MIHIDILNGNNEAMVLVVGEYGIYANNGFTFFILLANGFFLEAGVAAQVADADSGTFVAGNLLPIVIAFTHQVIFCFSAAGTGDNFDGIGTEACAGGVDLLLHDAGDAPLIVTGVRQATVFTDSVDAHAIFAGFAVQLVILDLGVVLCVVILLEKGEDRYIVLRVGDLVVLDVEAALLFVVVLGVDNSAANGASFLSGSLVIDEVTVAVHLKVVSFTAEAGKCPDHAGAHTVVSQIIGLYLYHSGMVGENAFSVGRADDNGVTLVEGGVDHISAGAGVLIVLVGFNIFLYQTADLTGRSIFVAIQLFVVAGLFFYEITGHIGDGGSIDLATGAGTNGNAALTCAVLAQIVDLLGEDLVIAGSALAAAGANTVYIGVIADSGKNHRLCLVADSALVGGGTILTGCGSVDCPLPLMVSSADLFTARTAQVIVLVTVGFPLAARGMAGAGLDIYLGVRVRLVVEVDCGCESQLATQTYGNITGLGDIGGQDLGEGGLVGVVAAGQGYSGLGVILIPLPGVFCQTPGVTGGFFLVFGLFLLTQLTGILVVALVGAVGSDGLGLFPLVDKLLDFFALFVVAPLAYLYIQAGSVTGSSLGLFFAVLVAVAQHSALDLAEFLVAALAVHLGVAVFGTGGSLGGGYFHVTVHSAALGGSQAGDGVVREVVGLEGDVAIAVYTLNTFHITVIGNVPNVDAVDIVAGLQCVGQSHCHIAVKVRDGGAIGVGHREIVNIILADLLFLVRVHLHLLCLHSFHSDLDGLFGVQLLNGGIVQRNGGAAFQLHFVVLQSIGRNCLVLSNFHHSLGLAAGAVIGGHAVFGAALSPGVGVVLLDVLVVAVAASAGQQLLALNGAGCFLFDGCGVAVGVVHIAFSSAIDFILARRTLIALGVLTAVYLFGIQQLIAVIQLGQLVIAVFALDAVCTGGRAVEFMAISAQSVKGNGNCIGKCCALVCNTCRVHFRAGGYTGGVGHSSGCDDNTFCDSMGLTAGALQAYLCSGHSCGGIPCPDRIVIIVDSTLQGILILEHVV